MTIFNQRANNPFLTMTVFMLTSSAFMFLFGLAPEGTNTFWIARLFLALPYVVVILFSMFLLWKEHVCSKKNSDDGDDDGSSEFDDDDGGSDTDESPTNIPEVYAALGSFIFAVIVLAFTVLNVVVLKILSLPMSHPRDIFQIALGSLGYSFVFLCYRKLFKKDVEPQEESDIPQLPDG